MAMNARGQGAVELALGTLALVSTLLLTLYLAEVGYLSLKVQEAGNFAAFEGAGERVHDFTTPLSGGNYAPLTGIGGRLGSTAQARYRDFDGLSASGGPNQTTQVVTRASNLAVTCEQTGNAGPQFPFPNGGGGAGRQLRSWYQNRGGVSCSAQARLTDVRLPGRFLDGPGGLSEQRLQSFSPMRVCSVGRAVSGNCRGRYAMLLGDWSLDADRTSPLSGDHPFLRTRDDPITISYSRGAYVPKSPVRNSTEVRNTPYWEMARQLWELSGPRYAAGQPGLGASRKMANAMEPVRRYPASERLYNERQSNPSPVPLAQGDDFAFSYAGPERGSQDVFTTSCPPCHFNTNGTFTVDGPREGNPLPLGRQWNKEVRRPCFLGLEGC